MGEEADHFHSTMHLRDDATALGATSDGHYFMPFPARAKWRSDASGLLMIAAPT